MADIFTPVTNEKTDVGRLSADAWRNKFLSYCTALWERGGEVVVEVLCSWEVEAEGMRSSSPAT